MHVCVRVCVCVALASMYHMYEHIQTAIHTCISIYTRMHTQGLLGKWGKPGFKGDVMLQANGPQGTVSDGAPQSQGYAGFQR